MQCAYQLYYCNSWRQRVTAQGVSRRAPAVLAAKKPPHACQPWPGAEPPSVAGLCLPKRPAFALLVLPCSTALPRTWLTLQVRSVPACDQGFCSAGMPRQCNLQPCSHRRRRSSACRCITIALQVAVQAPPALLPGHNSTPRSAPCTMLCNPPPPLACTALCRHGGCQRGARRPPDRPLVRAVHG